MQLLDISKESDKLLIENHSYLIYSEVSDIFNPFYPEVGVIEFFALDSLPSVGDSIVIIVAQHIRCTTELTKLEYYLSEILEFKNNVPSRIKE
jgi:hypothetical protein